MTSRNDSFSKLSATALLMLAALGLAEGTVAAPSVAGPPERVYDWETERCARWDIPDAPARAWRDSARRVRLIAGSETTRASFGAALDATVRDCSVLHVGAGNDDPAAFDDRAWIASVFAFGGGRVEALAHMEYHGHLRRDRCPAGDYAACWANAIVALSSDDGGATFERAAGGGALVAALPYRYDGSNGSRAGYFNPSNMLRVGEHLYVYVFAEAYRAQRRGACLLRRPLEGGADAWRAWDGADFSVRFADPYNETVRDPSAHVCAPLRGVTSTISSVVRRRADGIYLAVTPTLRRDAAGRLRSGVYTMVSADLVAWSVPELLFEAPLLWRRDCAAPAVYAYPSLLDSDSDGDSFEEVDDDFWLYLTEAPLDPDCRVGARRDLIRMRVSWPRG